MSVTYQFRLSDSEFAAQFLTEHFRRGPMVWLRMALALGVGIMSFRIYANINGSADTQLIQIASLCGLFYSGFILLKPFFSCLGALYMRSKMNSDEKNVQVEIDPRGIALMRAYLDRFWNQALEAFKVAAEQSVDTTDRS